MAVAIELKFIREDHSGKVSNDAQEDYIKIVERLLVAKRLRIEDHSYQNVLIEDIAFIDLVVCKAKHIFDEALPKLQGAMTKRPCPDNVFPIIFGHDELVELNPVMVQST
jgi:hypothetical protein